MVVIGCGPTGLVAAATLTGYTPTLPTSPYTQYVERKRPETPVETGDLVDELLHPQADNDVLAPPLLTFPFTPNDVVPNVDVTVVCQEEHPGGAWSEMPPRMLALSPAHWLELPGLPFWPWLICTAVHTGDRDGMGQWMEAEVGAGRVVLASLASRLCPVSPGPGGGGWIDVLREEGVDVDRVAIARPLRAHVAAYYADYPRVMGLDVGVEWLFSTRVTSLSSSSDPSGRRRGSGFDLQLARVDEGGVVGRLEADAVLLAVGSYSKAKVLGVAGEQDARVYYRTSDVDRVLSDEAGGGGVVVIGSGLSAADATLALLAASIPVTHIFRMPERGGAPLETYRGWFDAYPGYARLEAYLSGSQSHPLLTPVNATLDPVTAITSTHVFQASSASWPASCVFVLIGATPDLSFLPPPRSTSHADTVTFDAYDVDVDVDPISFEIVDHPHLYALGPLSGKNFVRFIHASSLSSSLHALHPAHHPAHHPALQARTPS